MKWGWSSDNKPRKKEQTSQGYKYIEKIPDPKAGFSFSL